MTLWKGFFFSLMRKYFSGLVDLKAQVTHPDWLKLILFFLLKDGFSLKDLASPGSDFTVNQDCLCRPFGKWPIWSSQEQLDLTALHPMQTSTLRIHTLRLSHYRLCNREKSISFSNFGLREPLFSFVCCGTPLPWKFYQALDQNWMK